MKTLSAIFLGLSVGMLSPIENKIYCFIPLAISIFFFYFDWYYNIEEAKNDRKEIKRV